MASSEHLRKNIKQHKPKNTESAGDDKEIYGAMADCIDYLEHRFPRDLKGYRLEFKKDISYSEMMGVVKAKKLRSEFDTTFMDRKIKPDGGVIWLEKTDDSKPPRLILVSEVKKQGTNKAREKEGLKKQAQGNAIERLGKNLTGIKAMMNHEKITPFVCFGWGCDFSANYTKDDFVMSKVSMLNEFYKLNKVYVYKRDGDSNSNSFAPVSMYFREKRWTRKEMFEILKEVGEDAIVITFTDLLGSENNMTKSKTLLIWSLTNS